MYTAAEPDPEFHLERHLIAFLQESVFFAELSRQITKVCTTDKSMPTAAVGYDPTNDAITMYYNPNFFKTLSHWEIRGVLRHEFYHLVFGHLSARRKKPARMWNVATDLAINSIITEDATKPRETDAATDVVRPLPLCALVPGRWPQAPGGREMTKEEKAGSEVATAIANFPKMESSEYYFSHLMEAAKKQRAKDKAEGKECDGDFGSDDWIDSMDEHDAWDEMPDAKRQYIEGKVRSMIEKAVRQADQVSSGWGSIPSELQEQIRRSVQSQVNWKSVLRQFIGQLVRGSRTTTIKRINRRYPYIHPGVKRGYVAKLLIARDESGSVYDAMLGDFCAELATLTRKVEIDFVPFDCVCNDKDVIRWTKGTLPEKGMKRTKSGGTDFSAPTRVFNDPKNRGRWDGLLIMTDGMADVPEPARGKRGWILGQGCKLHFESSELQIFLTKDKPMVGAWR